MSKKVLEIGNCSFDRAAIRRLIEEHFDAELISASQPEEVVQLLRRDAIDLVLVNRVLAADSSDGIQLIERIKTDPQLAATPVMLLSNYPKYQQQAAAVGAEPGFGKAELRQDDTREKLAAFLA